MQRIYEDIFQISIVPAKVIYKAEKYGNSPWLARKKFWDFKYLMYDGNDIEERIQAWQYVKAFTKLLKEKDWWDYTRGTPIPEPEWTKLIPGSIEWNQYYCTNKAEQCSMYQFRREHANKGGENANHNATN